MGLLDLFSRGLACLRAAGALDERRIAPSFSRPARDILISGIPLPRHESLAARSAVFVQRVLRDVRRAEPAPPAKVLFFADSVNQYNSLHGIRTRLQETGVQSTFMVLRHVTQAVNWKVDAVALSSRPADAFYALLCGLLFAPRLVLRLRKVRALSPFFDKVLDVHRHLPALLRTLDEVRPSLVVVANDHNTSCRLIAHLARCRGIPTLYLQHAQVNEHFPPLDYDFVFLDGEVALQAYSAIAARTGVTAANARIFLNGEKKTKPDRTEPAPRRTIGVAVSPVDRPDRLLPLVDALAGKGDVQVVIRPHPATPASLLEALARGCAGRPNVSIVGAREEPVAAFLDRLLYLVAGDSSIHMDALLRGVPTFHASLHAEPNFVDYYGFLRHGVVPPMPADEPPQGWARLAQDYAFDVSAIQKYSATFRTSWQGREEVLAALTVQALVADDAAALDELYPRNIAVRGLALGVDRVRAPA